MSVSLLHIRHQGPVIAALLNTAAGAIRGSGKSNGKSGNGPGPGSQAVLRQTIKPRNDALVRDFISHVGGDPANYRSTLPPHFFPQWGMPLLSKTLQGLPYNLSRVLNGGSRFESIHPLPSDQPLHLKAQLIEVDDNGYRVIFRQKLITGTAKQPESLISYVTAILPLKSSKGPKKQKPVVPKKAKKIDSWQLAGNAGLEFALLTGDFNPVHWVRPYAKLSGFPGTILHGFSTMGRAFESLTRTIGDGKPESIASFEVKFVKTLGIPGNVSVYLSKNEIFVGEAPGSPAYLTGTFAEKIGE
jgi:MaoC like domain